MRTTQNNGLKRAVSNWLDELRTGCLSTEDVNIELLLKRLPTSFNIYEPMLLLPYRYFLDPAWDILFKKVDAKNVIKLYENMAAITGTTHVALNAPIPNSAECSEFDKRNEVRMPVNIRPLYGDFGQVPGNNANPSVKELENAFWVSTKQNGIRQIWAPLYTMFARGNITEKARLLHLPSVREAHLQGQRDGRGWSAVDLHAGIGYFAFSYAKAGAKPVICWEINPWSFEGFRRGANKNRWEAHVVSRRQQRNRNDLSEEFSTEKKFVVFHESNTNAPQRLETIRKVLPPIRHVNCGLLPTSKDSWRTAVLCLDPLYGGWIHVHENLEVNFLHTNAASIAAKIKEFAKSSVANRTERPRDYDVILEHVQKVKSYSPHVVHCVLDISILPSD